MAGTYNDIERSTTTFWTSNITWTGPEIITSSVTTTGGVFTLALAEEWARRARDMQREEERILYGRWWDIKRIDPDLLMDIGL